MKHDGGPAFPQDLQGRRGDDPEYQGITLRDHLAGMAMQGFLANGDYDPTMIARKYAYEVADVMLKAREVSYD